MTLITQLKILVNLISWRFDRRLFTLSMIAMMRKSLKLKTSKNNTHFKIRMVNLNPKHHNHPLGWGNKTIQADKSKKILNLNHSNFTIMRMKMKTLNLIKALRQMTYSIKITYLLLSWDSVITQTLQTEIHPKTKHYIQTSMF